MVNASPLAQLKDIHLPTPIGWWPLAPGWYVLMVLVLILISGIAYALYKRYTDALAKKQALIVLTQYQKKYEQEHDSIQTSAHLSELIRRVALVYFPREHVASLYGEDWLHFLKQTSKGIDFNLVRNMLLETPFQTVQPIDLKPLFKAVRLWIKQRRIPCSN